MERQRIPGLMLAIVTKDSVLFAGGLGYSNIEAGRKVDAQQKFRQWYDRADGLVVVA